MSNELEYREVCAVTVLGDGDELDEFTTHRTSQGNIN